VRDGLRALAAAIQAAHPTWSPVQCLSLAKLRLTAQAMREQLRLSLD
jgi:hypothetical protein